MNGHISAVLNSCRPLLNPRYPASAPAILLSSMKQTRGSRFIYLSFRGPCHYVRGHVAAYLNWFGLPDLTYPACSRATVISSRKHTYKSRFTFCSFRASCGYVQRRMLAYLVTIFPISQINVGQKLPLELGLRMREPCICFRLSLSVARIAHSAYKQICMNRS